MGITETILTISGVIVAVGGAAVYIAKAIGAAMKPTNELKKEMQKHTKYLENDERRLDEHDQILREIKEDQKMMLKSLHLLLTHAETGNNTGEVKKAKKSWNSTFSKNRRKP